MMIKTIMEVHLYREMLSNLVKQNLKTKYKGSFFGFLWTFINPMLQLLVYTMVFSVIMRSGIENFAMYLFVGLIPWIFFNNSLIESSTSVLYNANLIKKIYFPRIITTIATVNVSFVNMVLSFIIVFIALLVSGVELTINVFYLPLVMAVEYILVLGISFIVAAVNVYFRDLQYLLGVIMMVWFYFTPIIYDISMVPERLLVWFNLNPMTHIIVFYRDILLFGVKPNFLNLLSILLISIVILILGVLIFNKLQKRFAEEL